MEGEFVGISGSPVRLASDLATSTLGLECTRREKLRLKIRDAIHDRGFSAGVGRALGLSKCGNFSVPN